MQRFTVLLNVHGTGKVQHIIWARTRPALEARIERVYPRRDIRILSITA
ncbi:MAG: hypothetical protein AAF092_05265 [Pseudomonadota bacterium]